MKLLMFHVREFWYRTHEPNLATETPRDEEGGLPGGGVLAWIQVESGDLELDSRKVRKASKALKWLARKVEAQHFMLHSFAHLSEDRADPEASRDIILRIAEKLSAAGYEVHHTPWGYFNEFTMHVEGPGIAKVFRDL